jgi:hypothetical protein
MVLKVMELVESVELEGCISLTDQRLTSLNLALRPWWVLSDRGKWGFVLFR